MITGYINTFLFALTLTVLYVMLLRPFANRFNLLDLPGNHKTHRAATPLVGGVAIYLAIATLVLLPGVTNLSFDHRLMLTAAGVLVAVGIQDDGIGLSVRLRFGIQILITLVVCLVTDNQLYVLGHLFSETTIIKLGWFALPFTIFAFLGVINATNMSDGLDGLAGSLALLTVLFLAVVALLESRAEHFSLLLILSGAIAGFLIFNIRTRRRHARIFLGDAGSTLLGFILAYLLIEFTQPSTKMLSPVTALWLFAVPLFDTVGIMLWRILRRKSPFCPCNNHLHHRLIEAGFSVNQTVTILAVFHGVMAAVGLWAYYNGVPENIMFMAFLFIFLVTILIFHVLFDRIMFPGKQNSVSRLQ